MDDLSNHYVKFVKFNEGTLQSLINETVKFSTVYEFNDFNEVHFGRLPNLKMSDLFHHGREMRDYVLNPETMIRLFELTLKSGNYSNERIEQLKKRVMEALPNIKEFLDAVGANEVNNSEGYNPFMVESLLHMNMGIFCMSHFEVFDDDAAQLMFAHYADNLKGLALIYSIDKTQPLPVKCEAFERPIDHLENLRKESLSHIADALFNENYESSKMLYINKSKCWGYENEYRAFGKPGITKASDANLKLQAILYTARFDSNQLDCLKNIKRIVYGGRLKLGKIYPNSGSFETCFKITSSNKPLSIREWLKSNPT